MFDIGVKKIDWVTIETVVQSPKVHIWCSMPESRMIGPQFFDNDTINGRNSHLMLKEFFVSELKRLGKTSSVIFRENGAPPHFNRNVRQYLDRDFLNRWVGRDGPIRWALRSLDLSMLDFFLCGYVKNNIYKSPIRNLDELKIKIADEIENIGRKTLSDVFSHLVKKMHLWISVEREHFKQVF